MSLVLVKNPAGHLKRVFLTHELLTAALLESIPLQKIEYSPTSTAALLYMPVAHLFLPTQFVWFTTPLNVHFDRTINAWVFSTRPTGIVFYIEFPANIRHIRTIF